jgi:ribosome-associated translation inhibitor RaiA
VQTVVQGQVAAWVVDYARAKTAALAGRVREPILFMRVKLIQARDHAVPRPAVVQAVVDLDGRLIRAHAAAATMREAVDLLTGRLQRRLADANEHWEARRGGRPGPGQWRHISESARRPDHFPRPVEDREIIRHTSFALPWESPDEAAFEMDSMDYDFHLFTDSGTGMDSVIYRAGPTGLRMAHTTSFPEQGPSAVPLTISQVSAPVLSTGQAAERLEALGLPFVFFVDPTAGRANVLYHRYDGHYGLITPADSPGPRS